MDDKQYAGFMSKLDLIVRLQAVGVVEGKSLRQQVALLSASGMQPKQIAEVLNKSANHISVILHEMRKEQRDAAVSDAAQESTGGAEATSV